MKVFNACALVIRRRYAAFLIYLVIFIAWARIFSKIVKSGPEKCLAEAQKADTVEAQEGDAS